MSTSEQIRERLDFLHQVRLVRQKRRWQKDLTETGEARTTFDTLTDTLNQNLNLFDAADPAEIEYFTTKPVEKVRNIIFRLNQTMALYRAEQTEASFLPFIRAMASFLVVTSKHFSYQETYQEERKEVLTYHKNSRSAIMGLKELLVPRTRTLLKTEARTRRNLELMQQQPVVPHVPNLSAPSSEFYSRAQDFSIPYESLDLIELELSHQIESLKILL